MEFNFNLEGGNFSRAGAASSEIKKILKQLNVDALLIKRIVVALYEAEVNVVAHAYEGVMTSCWTGNLSSSPSPKRAGYPRYSEGYAGRLLDRFARSPGNGIRCRDGITQYEKKL